MGKQGKKCQTFSGLQNHCRCGDCSHEIKRHLLLGRKVMTSLNSIFKSRDITLPTKVRLVKAMVFPSGHIWMWELDCEERWAPKNWCFWTVVLEKTLESPLNCKDIQPVHPKRDRYWVFIGWADVEPETPILWPPDVKSWLIWKDPDAGKDWRQEEKGTTEDEIIGWHHQLNGHEFGKFRELLMDREAWHAAVHRITKNRTQLNNWTELNWVSQHYLLKRLFPVLCSLASFVIA